MLCLKQKKDCQQEKGCNVLSFSGSVRVNDKSGEERDSVNFSCLPACFQVFSLSPTKCSVYLVTKLRTVQKCFFPQLTSQHVHKPKR